VSVAARVVERLLEERPQSRDAVERIKLDVARSCTTAGLPKNNELLAQLDAAAEPELARLLRVKPMRTSAGVAPVAIMTSPAPCPHGTCTYCPGGPTNDAPQSYTGHEPAARRGARHGYDPQAQVAGRLEQYARNGHPTDKVELIIMGGTFTAREPEYLVPSHTRPIMGRTAVDAALTGYHAGVSSVLQQTLAGMNRGLRPDELVEQVTLPPELADNPYLQEFYGTVAWSVRSIYTFHLGWFDGNATSLFPLSNRDRAARIIRLSGGEAAVLEAGRAALAAGNFQWAAELADYVLAGDNDHAEGRELKASALAELGERQISANARNYYLSTAQALRQGR